MKRFFASKHPLKRILGKEDSAVCGLFGLEDLRNPEDWAKLSAKAIQRCRALTEVITHSPPSAETIRHLDDISDSVCQIHDAAEFCWNVHTDQAWQQQAQQTCINLGGYVNELNHNKDLYDALAKSLRHYERLTSNQQASSSSAGASRSDNYAARQGFTAEALMVGKLLLQDFEKAGIHMAEDQRAEVAKVTAQMSQCGMAIRTNIARSEGQMIGPRSYLHHHHEGRRKQAYQDLSRIPEENRALLDMLAQGRHHLASLFGHASYAEYTLNESCLARKPEAVVKFLTDLYTASQTQLHQEMELLRSGKQSLAEGAKTPELMIWDREICAHMVKARQGNLSESAQPYFHVKTVLEGLQEVLKRTFDLRMEEVSLKPGEGWAPGLLKLSFWHDDEGPMGDLYVDPLARQTLIKLQLGALLLQIFRISFTDACATACCTEGKLAGSAHFTLRCRKLLSSGQPQHPLAALVFDFRSMLMTPGEMKVFFHEFGHALHTILSRAEFQHLAGTRGPMDMVEIPSHFFEHFLQNEECLELCTKHYLTGDTMPKRLQKSLQQHWGFMPALDMNDSIVNAMVDQQFHSRQIAGSDACRVVSDAIEQYSAFHPQWDAKIFPHLRFGHLVTYGASYYAYPYAKFLASAIWQRKFAADPFCKKAGSDLRDKLLGLGGAKAPRLLIEDLLGPGSLQSINGGFAPTIS